MNTAAEIVRSVSHFSCAFFASFFDDIMTMSDVIYDFILRVDRDNLSFQLSAMVSVFFLFFHDTFSDSFTKNGHI